MQDMTLSEIILTLLQKYKLSQRKLAERADVNYVTLNRIIKDYKFRATGETIEKIAKGLGCTKEERDEMLRAARRIPEDVEIKFSESTNAARLFRRIVEMKADEVDDLLKELEGRKPKSKH